MTRFTGLGRLVFATVVAGTLAGIGAIGFHYIADVFGEALFHWAEVQAAPMRLPFVVIVPAAGLFLIGLVLQKFPETRLGGVREVLDALEHHSGYTPLYRIWNVILSGLVLAFGGSVGPEGPMVQLGALAGSIAGRGARMSGRELRTIVRAGAAAGISAAFRSPAGGVLLTLEVFGSTFNSDLVAIAIAAGLGYVLRTALLGDAYPFRPTVPIEPLPVLSLILIVPLMGLLAAPTGHLFIRMFDRFKTAFPAHWPLSIRVAFGGLLVGVIGIWYPQVMSAGYPVIKRGVDGGLPVQLFATLLALKMLATSITFGSGAVGGLFAPTLVIGSLFGGAYGYGLHRIFPDLVPQPELFVLLGMVVMFSSIIKGYWSGLLMVADLSGCYHQLLLPGVIAGGISFFLSWEIYARSILGLTIHAGHRASRRQKPPAIDA
jgi:CIC family chloride channel protein